VWNIPFNGLGVAGTVGFKACAGQGGASTPFRQIPSATLTSDKLLAKPGWSSLLHELMLEVIAAGRALGFRLDDSLADKNMELTRTMGPYKASTLIDFERRLPLELESMFLEPLRQAHSAGVPVPRLERLCEILCRLDPTAPAHGNRNPKSV
jgi:2-dehydropantoate 2-reductase